MSAPNNHPEVDELVDWARGDLSRKRLREIRVHCRSCTACDMNLAKILVLRTRQRREMKRRAKRGRQLQMAAAIVLLVGAGAVFLFSGYFSDPASELAALATTETIRGSHLRLRFGEGLPADVGQYEARLKAGMEALVQGDFPLSIETFENLHREYASSSEVACYLGVALYLSGDDSDHTKQLLAKGILNRQPLIQRTTTWYLANASLRTGDLETAIELLESLNLGDRSDFYSRSAEDLILGVERIRER